MRSRKRFRCNITKYERRKTERIEYVAQSALVEYSGRSAVAWTRVVLFQSPLAILRNEFDMLTQQILHRFEVGEPTPKTAPTL